MSEILVRVIDKTSNDVSKDVQLLKRGDVVAILPDGWKWSIMELFNPDWRIICADITPDMENRLLISEANLHIYAYEVDDVMRQARASYIDVDNIDCEGFADYINDRQRTFSKYYVPNTFDFSSIIIDKQRRKNPHEIG